MATDIKTMGSLFSSTLVYCQKGHGEYPLDVRYTFSMGWKMAIITKSGMNYDVYKTNNYSKMVVETILWYQLCLQLSFLGIEHFALKKDII